LNSGFEKDVMERAFDGCCEALVEFTNNSMDSEVLLEASMSLFNLITKVLAKASMVVFNNFKDYEKIGLKCTQNISKIIKNENEKTETRVKAIKYVLYKSKDELDRFKNDKSLPHTACSALIDIVLSGKSYSIGYLEAVRLYFDATYRHEPPPEIEKRTPAIKIGRNDPCFCGSGKKYKKCCCQKGTATIFL